MMVFKNGVCQKEMKTMMLWYYEVGYGMWENEEKMEGI